MKSIYPLILMSFGLYSCASIHPGEVAQNLNHNERIPLKVSAQIDPDVDSKANTLVHITFENTGDQWVKVDSLEVLIDPSEAQKVSLVVGKDLDDWFKAYSEKRALNAQNRSVVLTSLLVGGIVANAIGSGSSSSGWQTLGTAGGIAAAGAGGVMVGDAITASKRRQEKSSSGSSDNIDQIFSVPGNLYVRKWLLLNKPADRLIEKLVLRLKTIEGETETYVVNL